MFILNTPNKVTPLLMEGFSQEVHKATGVRIDKVIQALSRGKQSHGLKEALLGRTYESWMGVRIPKTLEVEMNEMSKTNQDLRSDLMIVPLWTGQVKWGAVVWAWNNPSLYQIYAFDSTKKSGYRHIPK